MTWRFKTVPHGYWMELVQDSNEVSQMVEWLSNQLSIKSLDDWYRVSIAQMRKWVQIASPKDMHRILEISYPQHEWDMSQFDRPGFNTKSSQREVMVAMERLFPTHSMYIL